MPDVSLVTVTYGDRLAAVRVGTGLDAVQRSGGDPPMEVVVLAVGPEGRQAAEELVEHAVPAGLQPEIVDVEAGLRGHARAANTGAAKASGDVIVVANPAVTFHQRLLRRLRSEAEERWDFLAPAVREGEGGKIAAGATRRARTHRLVRLPNPPRQPTRVSAGNGCCVILRRATLERRVADAGHLFDEAYGEAGDLELFWWAERQGLVVRYVPELYVGHAVGQQLLRSAEERRRSMAHHRVTVWRYATEPRDWLGWVLAEGAFVSEEFAVGQLGGVGR